MWTFRKDVLSEWPFVLCWKRRAQISALITLLFRRRKGQRTRDKGPRAYFPYLVSIVTAFCLLPAAFCFSSGLYEVIEVKPHVFLWEPEDIIYQTGDPQFNRATAAGFIITSEGVVVVNTTNNPLNARDLLYEIRERTSLPVKYVINTDWRGDHMLGNEVFADLEATMLAASVAKVKMQEYERDLDRRMNEDSRIQARMRGIHFSLPNQTFNQQMALRPGGLDIRLLDVGKGALAGTAVVYLPDAKVLFLGGLYDLGVIPRWGLSDIHAWIDTLRQVESIGAETFVPDQGPPGDKGDLTEFREFLEWVAEQTEPSVLLWKPSSKAASARMVKVQE